MRDERDIERFVEAQAHNYEDALAELHAGAKRSHWMWYVFPQLRGLGRSRTAWFYGLDGAGEARRYEQHPLLGPRLVACTAAVLRIEGRSARQIMGSPDDLKLRSCMTLFSRVSNAPEEFISVLDRYYDGLPDPITLEHLADRG